MFYIGGFCWYYELLAGSLLPRLLVVALDGRPGIAILYVHPRSMDKRLIRVWEDEDCIVSRTNWWKIAHEGNSAFSVFTCDGCAFNGKLFRYKILLLPLWQRKQSSVLIVDTVDQLVLNVSSPHVRSCWQCFQFLSKCFRRSYRFASFSTNILDVFDLNCGISVFQSSTMAMPWPSLTAVVLTRWLRPSHIRTLVWFRTWSSCSAPSSQGSIKNHISERKKN